MNLSSISKKIAKRVCMCLILVMLSSCSDSVPSDDAGHKTFVQQAMMVLLGKRANGVEEIELLADLSVLLGRKWVIRALMERPEFEETWQHHLMDFLRVQRGGRRDQPSTCFAEPLRILSDGTPKDDFGLIAQVVRDNQPDVPVPGTIAIGPTENALAPQEQLFNMNDHVRSSIRLDDISGIMSSYLFPFTNRGVTSLGGEEGRLALTDIFANTFLNRSFECVQCHNPGYSLTNKPDWHRTWAIPINTDSAVFGRNNNIPTKMRKGMSPLFRQDIAIQDDEITNETKLRPWGMSSECGFYRTTLANQDEITFDNITPFFAGLSNSRMSIGDLVERYRLGYEKIRLDGIETTGTVSTSSGTLATAPNDESLAFMVAAAMTNFVWEKVMGRPLIIENYFARTEEQMMMHWKLTNVFVVNGFSLHTLLERILLGDYFNRQSPLNSGQDGPYLIPLIINPWVQQEACPNSIPAGCRNGQGALVHSWSSRTLLSSVSHALGWPQPKVFPSKSNYPDSSLATSTGQYLNDLETGSKSVSFQGLLGYESEIGACEKQTGSSKNDWIDQLVDAVTNVSREEITIRDVVFAVKNRLIQYPLIGSYPKPGGIVTATDLANGAVTETGNESEVTALVAHFGQPLQSAALSVGVTNLEKKIRQYCGVLIKSPQFMLAGVVPKVPSNKPKLRVCLPNEPCSYREMCKIYRDDLNGLGQYIGCQSGSVVKLDSPQTFDNTLAIEFCPIGSCTHLPSARLQTCLANPSLCQMRSLPPCDPRRTGTNSCGSRPSSRVEQGAFLALLENADVTRADEVDILMPGSRQYRTLVTGESLTVGSVIRLMPGSHFDAHSGAIRMQTPLGGMPHRSAIGQRELERELFTAAGKSISNYLTLLHEKGAVINERNEYGETALMLAARNGDEESVGTLLDLGADWTLTDENGHSVVDWADESQSVAVTKLLEDRGIGNQIQTYLTKKSEVELPRTRAIEPWYVIVSGSSLLDASGYDKTKLDQIAVLKSALNGDMRTGQAPGDLLAKWRTEEHRRGLSGEIYTLEEEQQRARIYREKYYHLEHD